MTIVGSFLSRVLNHSSDRVEEIQRELAGHKATIRQNTQVLQSGSRVMQNMTGMMRVMVAGNADEN